MRLFVAIPLPVHVIAALTDLQQRVRILMPEGDRVVRWTRTEQFHLTLRFFGNVEEEKLEALRDRLHQAVLNFNPFDLQLGHCGCFPNSNHPRILWVGLEGDVASLNALHESIRIQTADFGQPPDDRKFQPHLTLGRLRHSSRAQNFRKKCEAISAPVRSASWTVNEMQLIYSRLSAEGSIYRMIAQVRFRT